ncbi:MAG: twin-arginine translocation signal domain-containing protein [Oscillatoriales cyanobacterium]|nr:MAG: twin-arginine translocation signal domain-containing protein [Oscillatoriales cyanobacterium]
MPSSIAGSRRQFLQHLLTGGAVAAGLSGWWNRALVGQAQTPIALPAPPPDRGTLRMIAISDLNNRYGDTDYRAEVHQAIALIRHWRPDLVLCGGDMVAGQKLGLTSAQFQAMWAGFDRDVFQPIQSAGIPFVFTFGNHDASNLRSADRSFKYEVDRAAANRYWQDHRNQLRLNWVDDRDFPFFYAVRQGDTFILSWDASGPAIDPAQLTRAEQLLTSEAGRSARHRLVLGHLPLYAVSPERNGPGHVLPNTAALLALFAGSRVSAYITGHHHAYFPARQGSVDLLHLGCLGGGVRSWLGSSASPIRTLTVIDIQPDRPDLRYSSYQLNPTRAVSYSQLPARITGFNGQLVRRDLTFGDNDRP